MAEHKASVRVAAVGGKALKAELQDIGRSGDQALQQIGTAGGRSGAQIQNAAYQIGDFAVQVAGGTSASRAFAQQLPQLLGGLGVFGAVAGAAAAILIPFTASMLGGADATEKLVDELVGAPGSIGAVDSAVRALEQTQKRYTEAINSSGGASSAAASLVLANSEAEFKARKKVLEIELQLLRIRGQERTADLANLQDGMRREGATAMENYTAWTGVAGVDDVSAYVNLGPRNRSEVDAQLDGFLSRNEQTSRAIEKLTAENELNNQTIASTEALMNSTFESLTTGAGKAEKAAKGAAGGAGALNEAQREAEKLFEATRTGAERYAAEVDKLDALLAAGAITSETYNRALAMFREKYLDAGDATSFFKDSLDEAQDAIIDLALEGEAGFDKIAKAISRAALQALLFGEGPLSGMFGGKGSGIFSSLAAAFGLGGGKAAVPSMDGGGFTGWGPRSGGLDGRGGFMAMLHPRETVTDHTKGQSVGRPGEMRIALADGLVAQILHQSAQQTIQIVNGAFGLQQRNAAKAQANMAARGGVA